MLGSKNKFAYEIVKSGIFNNVKNFNHLLERIKKNKGFNHRGIETSKGDIFEIFCEAYLNINKEFQVKDVYPQGYVPIKILKKLKLNRLDKGYDGVYETLEGNFNTYQAKYRFKNERLTWQGRNGLSSFIGVSEKAYRRHLIATTNKVSSEFENKSRVRMTLHNDLNRISLEDLLKISDFLNKRSIKIRRHKPDEYQKTAVSKIINELKSKDRTTVIMACGTGKTEIGLWVYEKIKPKICLVLVPSIALVKQIRAGWLSQIEKKIMTFQLCSSKDITKQEDCIKVRETDLDMEIYNDVPTLKKWLKKKPNLPKIIFSTYQSSKILKNIFTKRNKIDFAIFDEAHRTALLNSKIDSYFTFALYDKNIPIKKRLFTTATRRISSNSKFKKEGDAVLQLSMDNENIYGKICYNLSFYEAANRYKAIAKPRIIISEVYSDEISAEKRRLSSTHVKGSKLKSDYLAIIIAVKKTVEKYKIKKVFSFHNGVENAKIFTDGNQPESIKYHLNNFFTSHVRGSMSMRKRDEIMEEFISSPKSLVSNARCLIEGVNVPSVDMVTFINPKESEIDIVQAIGRALRNRGQNKKFGYVLVPIFVERNRNESIEKSLERTNFKKVITLLKALREHDTEIAQIIDEIVINESRGKGFSERNKKKIKDLIETVNPEIKKRALVKAIHASVISNLRLKWDEMLGHLLEYKKNYGTTNVMYEHKKFINLRKWISNVRLRYRLNKLYNFQIEQLKKVGFDFNEPGATVFKKGDLESIQDIGDKYGLDKGTVRKALNGVKPDEYYYGSGIKKPIPLFKYITSEYLKKRLKVTCLKRPKGMYTGTRLHLSLFTGATGLYKNLGKTLVIKLIKEGKIKPKEIGVGLTQYEKLTKYYKPLNKKNFTKLTKITIYKRKDNQVTKTQFIKRIFGRRTHNDYFDYCEKKGLIKAEGIGIAVGSAGPVKLYKLLNYKEFMKLNNLDFIDPPKNFVTMTEFSRLADKDKGVIGRMIKLKLIKSVGTGYSARGITDYYKIITKRKFGIILEKYRKNIK